MVDTLRARKGKTMANYGPLRDVARKWLFNPDYPNECATQGEVDDLTTLLNDVRAKAIDELSTAIGQDEFLDPCDAIAVVARARLKVLPAK